MFFLVGVRKNAFSYILTVKASNEYEAAENALSAIGVRRFLDTHQILWIEQCADVTEGEQ